MTIATAPFSPAAHPAIISAHHNLSLPATRASVSGSGIDPTFDFLVSLMAPEFRMTSAQFPDFAALRADYERWGILTVNTNFSDSTIFGSPYTNFQFRAWHDAAHIALDADFSHDGETRAMLRQLSQVWALRGPAVSDKYRWDCLIQAEVAGQLEYFERTGEFVQDQREFTIAYLWNRFGLRVSDFPRTLEGLTIER